MMVCRGDEAQDRKLQYGNMQYLSLRTMHSTHAQLWLSNDAQEHVKWALPTSRTVLREEAKTRSDLITDSAHLPRAGFGRMPGGSRWTGQEVWNDGRVACSARSTSITGKPGPTARRQYCQDWNKGGFAKMTKNAAGCRDLPISCELGGDAVVRQER